MNLFLETVCELKVKPIDLYNTQHSSLQCSDMARVDEGSQRFTCCPCLILRSKILRTIILWPVKGRRLSAQVEVTYENDIPTNGCPSQQLDQKGSTVNNDSSNISAVQVLTKWVKHPQSMYPLGNCGIHSRGGNLSRSTAFPAQQLWLSGFFSCQPYGLELSHRFHPGPGDQYRQVSDVLSKRVHQLNTDASSALGVL